MGTPYQVEVIDGFLSSLRVLKSFLALSRLVEYAACSFDLGEGHRLASPSSEHFAKPTIQHACLYVDDLLIAGERSE